MRSGSNKPVNVAGLRADIAAASVELLSAHCAADRVRLKYSLRDIVTFAEPTALRKAVSSASALCRFFSQIEAHIQYDEDSSG